MSDPVTNGMYRTVYFEITDALDEILGTEEEDGAGEGLLADVWLVANQRDEARLRWSQANLRLAAYEGIEKQIRAYLASAERVDPLTFLRRLQDRLDEVDA